jgi:hypothetical protein
MQVFFSFEAMRRERERDGADDRHNRQLRRSSSNLKHVFLYRCQNIGNHLPLRFQILRTFPMQTSMV